MENKKEVAIYEEVIKDIVKREEGDYVLPISSVLGRGSLVKQESFGGKSLVENAQKVDEAFNNTNGLQEIWNHSHSQFTWKHINLSYHSPWKNMRQIAAEMSSKKRALDDAKWGRIENEVKLRQLEEQLEKEHELEYWKAVKLKIKLAKLKEGLSQSNTIIEGAMKDVLALNELYDQLKDQVSNFSEEEVEREEAKAHLKRSLVQCIRDVRQSGHITKGEQEYLEQIGVNPGRMQMMMAKYVAEERVSEDWSSKGLYSFVDHIATELIDNIGVDKIRMEIMGFDSEYNPEFSSKTKTALVEIDD